MAFGLFSKKILGLDIGTSSLKLCELDVKKDKATLVKFAYSPLPPRAVEGGEITDPQLVGQMIQQVYQQNGFKAKHVAAGLFGSSVVTRKISMPKMDSKLIREQLRWEAEQYLPMDINQSSLEYQILKSKKEPGDNQSVLIVAAKHEHIFRYFETIAVAGLKTEIIDVASFALANCFEFNYGKSSDSLALVNIGHGITNFVVLDGGDVTYSRDIPFGALTYTAEIQKEMGVSFEEADALKTSASQNQAVPQEVNTAIYNLNDQFADEIVNSFNYYINAIPNGQKISRFFLTGGGVYIPGIAETISKASRVPYEMMNPFLKISHNPKYFSAEYMQQIKMICPVALGLALRRAGDS